MLMLSHGNRVQQVFFHITELETNREYIQEEKIPKVADSYNRKMKSRDFIAYRDFE